MKKILLLLLLIAPVYCFAQTDSVKYKQKEEFCEVQVSPSSFGKFVIMTDNSQDKSGKLTKLKDAAGNNRKFGSMVEILNYMAKYGWVLVTSYNEVFQGESGGTHLLYKREL
jgi:hypothetical protein